jgi:hypothetical protein
MDDLAHPSVATAGIETDTRLCLTSNADIPGNFAVDFNACHSKILAGRN